MLQLKLLVFGIRFSSILLLKKKKENLIEILLKYSVFSWNTCREHTFLLDIFNLVMNKTDQSSFWLLYFFLAISPVNTS